MKQNIIITFLEGTVGWKENRKKTESMDDSKRRGHEKNKGMGMEQEHLGTTVVVGTYNWQSIMK